MESKERIIVALDVDGLEKALGLVDKLHGHVGGFKVGKRLFTACGPEVVRYIEGDHNPNDSWLERRVFLDLKYHDIPNTVAQAATEAARLGVKMFNVHAMGGKKMMVAAQQALHLFYKDKGWRPMCLAVTILTSMDLQALTEVGFDPKSSVEQHVVNLTSLAYACGLDGVVCSPNEAPVVRKEVGTDSFLIVTPGIRPAGAEKGDQARTDTPSGALKSGVSMMVIGRPIIEAPDPVAAALAIAAEMDTVEI